MSYLKYDGHNEEREGRQVGECECGRGKIPSQLPLQGDLGQWDVVVHEPGELVHQGRVGGCSDGEDNQGKKPCVQETA